MDNIFYFIDSENVGDYWIALLPTLGLDDKLLVFYTKNSPRISYDALGSILRENCGLFSMIRCVEGNNALDFQLCTDLGYRICAKEAEQFIILSNDTGFDAAVNYWTQRGFNVTRMKTSANISDSASVKVNSSASVDPVYQVREPMLELLQEKTEISVNPPYYDSTAKEILYLIGKNNLQLLYQSLQQIYGSAKGTSVYNHFKSNMALYKDFLATHSVLNTKEKRRLYCSIVFEHSLPNEEMPDDFPSCTVEAWIKKKNLNSFRAFLQSHYGKERCEKYYRSFKSHIKILSCIK